MSSFVFQSPMTLTLLPFVVPAAFLLRRARYRRGLVVSELAGPMPEIRHQTRDRCRLLALVLLLLALARPGYSPQRHAIAKNGRDVVFLLDVSQSMLARDAHPSRLQAAKAGILDSLETFHNERVALVIYAGSANILCPLTYDYNFLRYMLDQASPRAVDFGGTALLSAVEKSVDNVLSAKRSGMHDLVVLTDGEEHDPQIRRIAGLLNDKHLGLLVIGLGDSESGSRIPIVDESGRSHFLKFRDQVVSTRLNSRGLDELASATDDAAFIQAGTRPFDLATLYADFVRFKPVSSADGKDVYVVYREAGFALMALAMILLLVAELWPMRASKVVLVIILCVIEPMIQPSRAADSATTGTFEKAMDLQRQGAYEEAVEFYEQVAQNRYAAPLTPTESACLRYNEGLCFLAQAKKLPAAEARQALMIVGRAQTCFLAACRLQPGFHRAGRRLDPTYRLIDHFKRLVAEEEDRARQSRQQMEELVRRLQALHRQQSVLRNEVGDQRDRRSTRRRASKPTRPSGTDRVVDPTEPPAFADRQRLLHDDGVGIAELMRQIDQDLPANADSRTQTPSSVLQQHRRLMKTAVSHQSSAASLLEEEQSWTLARGEQMEAVTTIQQILDLLTSSQASDSDGEQGEDEEEWDLSEMSDSEGAVTSSLPTRGEMARGASMLPLPIPNYSVEDILQEEMGNQQFRQQQRTKGNQEKVEKDW